MFFSFFKDLNSNFELVYMMTVRLIEIKNDVLLANLLKNILYLEVEMNAK